jgi:hypothetical protein
MKILVLIAVLGMAQAQPSANVTGTWEWQGPAGWQRIILTLKSDGSNVTGVIRMGPGSHEPAVPADFWEYFFDPVDFKISNGTVSGNLINFEHTAARAPATTQSAVVFAPLRPNARPVPDRRFVYKGIVQGNEIAMTREVVSDPKDTWSIGTHKVELSSASHGTFGGIFPWPDDVRARRRRRDCREYGRLYDDLMLDSMYTIEFNRGPQSEDLPEPIQIRVKEANLRAFYSRNP